MSEEKKDKRLVLRIFIKEDGTIIIDSIFKKGQLVINLLADAIKITASQPDKAAAKDLSVGQLSAAIKDRFRPKGKHG